MVSPMPMFHYIKQNIFLPEPTCATKSDIEQFAQEAINAFGLKRGGDLYSLVARLGGKIETGSVDGVNRQSHSIVIDSRGRFTIFLPMFTTAIGDRLAIALQLGHYLLHYPTAKAQMQGADSFSTARFDKVDSSCRQARTEAVWFANSLLDRK